VKALTEFCGGCRTERAFERASSSGNSIATCMKVVLDKHPQIVAYALEAIKRAGLKPVLASIRLLDKARQSV
jgi:hypothetical protein